VAQFDRVIHERVTGEQDLHLFELTIYVVHRLGSHICVAAHVGHAKEFERIVDSIPLDATKIMLDYVTDTAHPNLLAYLVDATSAHRQNNFLAVAIFKGVFAKPQTRSSTPEST
jgi:hypothetical protein